MNPIPLMFRMIFSMLCFVMVAPAHQVETVEFEFQRLDKVWRLHGEMDIAYMLPETRAVPGGQPLSRKAVMKAPPEELARIRKETEKTLRRLLTMTHGGEPLKWSIEFPDFDKKPFTLPEEYADWALMTVRLVVDKQNSAGDFAIHWDKDDKAELIILTSDSEDGDIVSVQPGGSLVLMTVRETSTAKTTTGEGDPGIGEAVPAKSHALLSWVISGYRHVLPLGLDHMLFIFGLFVAVLKWKPMLWQSLLFTLSHSLTLALCAFGLISLEPRLIEIFIAFSIAFIGLEDLFRVKVGKRRYVLVFVFGLLHGMGFANVLADKVKGVPKEDLVQPLLGFNLGVELAQITVVLAGFLLFALIGKKKKHQKTGQFLGSLLVALAGLGWMVERIFFAG